MGMFDNVKCKYPLPGAPEKVQDADFQTKDFGDGCTGGYLDNYTVTKDGRLIKHEVEWEMVPENKRPYYGKPEWNKSSLFQLAGCMKTNSLGDKEILHHGYLQIYTVVGDSFYNYRLKFTDGRVVDVERLGD